MDGRSHITQSVTLNELRRLGLLLLLLPTLLLQEIPTRRFNFHSLSIIISVFSLLTDEHAV